MHSAPQLKEQIKQTIQTFASDHYEHDVLYLVLHTSFKHLLAFDGAHKLEAKDIQDIIDTVKPTIRILVGDIHTRNTLSLEGGDNSYIHSSGSLYPLSFDKSGDTHSMSLITADSGAIEPIDCTVRKYSSITYSDKQSLKAYTDKLVQANPTDFLQPFVNVIIPETVDVQLHTSEYPGVIIRCVKERQEEIEQSEIARRTGYTLEQAVEDEIGEGEEVLQDLAAALYASDDPLAEINNWLNYWEVEKV